jgi:phospholipid/cholesterol/gamma-HCH transport system ATP-binding protein
MPEDSPNSVVRFERVTVAFDDVTALRELSFDAKEGETRVILGAAGSGKTVLLKTALGLQKADRGVVRVFGQDVSQMSEKELFEMRSRIGMLFQESALFDSLTIEENVAYPLENQPAIACPPEEVHPRVEEALRFVELEGTLEKFPSELSGGMRRRAAIARAVVTRPPLLLYDSPTAGLDPITAHTIVALIVKERDLSNTTTLIVTHRYQDGKVVANFRYNPDTGGLAAARNGNSPAPRTCFMVLQEGRLVFEGSQSALEASRDPYIRKFARQRE